MYTTAIEKELGGEMHTHPMPFHTFDAAIRASSVYRSLWCASYRSRRPAWQRCSVTTDQLADNPQRPVCLDSVQRDQPLFWWQ